MIKALEKNKFYEEKYEMENEPLHSALFTTGNGYIGVRGSFEEYGSLRIQGAYIRGLFDEIYEIIEPFCDNEYMKKYYINEDKLKNFEKQDSIINFADFLLVRVEIDGETFYPWEGEILEWTRYIDMEKACLVREVSWKNSKGDITNLRFERFSSFHNDHSYSIKVEITPINHNKQITVLSGIDTRTKTGGQKVTQILDKKLDKNKVCYKNLGGEKYKFEFATAVNSKMFCDNKEMAEEWRECDNNGIIASEISFSSKENNVYRLEKEIFVITSREFQGDLMKKASTALTGKSYEALFEEHMSSYRKVFDVMDIEIEGDLTADAGVRFANYHSIISISRNDSIHGLSAKTLSGERYNNFVWWDSEIYQLPIFIYTMPDAAKNALIYRYNILNGARENAKLEGKKGARFAFVSSVNGDELVWEYARHPFLQIHITADVAYGVIHYYEVTKDKDFMMNYGLEILFECARYWADTVEYKDGKYQLFNVTGTDEHHPYVNNDAYTNYLVCEVLKHGAYYYSNIDCEKVSKKINLSSIEVENWKEISEKIYLPMIKDSGLIPQFDNYFDLSRTLEEAGGSNAKQFQMKSSGLYHKSQVIKQPDVMLLFSYLNLKFDSECYSLNWDYYEKMCESSSSLSFPVHAICSADNNRMLSAYNYLIESCYIDILDIHHCGWQGVHAGCLAGAWYTIFRGIAGITFEKDTIKINPHTIPWWKSLKFNFIFRNAQFNVLIKDGQFILSTDSEKEIEIIYKGEKQKITKGMEVCHEI